MNVLMVKTKEYEKRQLNDFFDTVSSRLFFAEKNHDIYRILSESGINAVLYFVENIDDFAMIRFINQNYPEVKVLVITENYICTGIDHIKESVFTYLRQPYSLEQIDDFLIRVDKEEKKIKK